MRYRDAFMIGALVILAFLIPKTASAQITGTILGTVRDKAGAAVPDALVTVENQAIALSRSAKASDQGDYAFPALPVGTYVIKAQANGFAPYQSAAFAIVINQQARVDITLAVGSMQQSVEVTAAIPIVDTATSTLGEVMEESQVVGLPLNGRNFLQLATLQPGVAPATVQYQPSAGSKLLNQMAQTTSQVNGLRIQSNNYQIDGGDENEPFYGFISAVSDPDAIEEFKILTNAYSAEFGRASGGVVNVITR
jgi:outer membrane receptor protein involved in Fe transport